MSPNLRGAMLMMASMAAFTLNDTCIKATGGALPLFQLLTVRGLLTTLLIYLLARHLGALRFDLSRRDWGLVITRSSAEVGAAYFFITALLNMPLANVTAVLQVLPLTVTLGAAMFFREPVGWRRFSAIAIGFLYPRNDGWPTRSDGSMGSRNPRTPMAWSRPIATRQPTLNIMLHATVERIFPPDWLHSNSVTSKRYSNMYC